VNIVWINTARVLRERFGIDEKTTQALFDEGFLYVSTCRNTLIKEEYEKHKRSKEKMRLKGRLAEKYSLSTDSVRKIVEH